MLFVSWRVSPCAHLTRNIFQASRVGPSIIWSVVATKPTPDTSGRYRRRRVVWCYFHFQIRQTKKKHMKKQPGDSAAVTFLSPIVPTCSWRKLGSSPLISGHVKSPKKVTISQNCQEPWQIWPQQRGKNQFLGDTFCHDQWRPVI